MDEVSRALPDLVWIERMEYHGNAISLEGKAFNPPAVANFIANLRLVSAFQEPKLADLSACSGAAGSTLYCYKMSFTFSNLDRTQPETAAPAPAKPAEPPKKAERAAGGAAGVAGM